MPSNGYPVLLFPSRTVMRVKLYFVAGVSEDTSYVMFVSWWDPLMVCSSLLSLLSNFRTYIEELTFCHIRVILFSVWFNTCTSSTFSGAEKKEFDTSLGKPNLGMPSTLTHDRATVLWVVFLQLFGVNLQYQDKTRLNLNYNNVFLKIIHDISASKD